MIADLLMAAAKEPFQQQAMLLGGAEAVQDQFGYAIAISGDSTTCVVGAPYHDAGGGNGGAFYIFKRDGTSWSQQAYIVPAGTAANDFAGFSVSISEDGNTVAVGAYQNATAGTGAGCVYVYTRTGTSWGLQVKLTPSWSSQTFNRFGYSVDLSNDGNTLVVGAPIYTGTGADFQGLVAVYTRSGSAWGAPTTITIAGALVNDQLGTAVAISGDGNTLALGAIGANTAGIEDVGAVYVYTRSGSVWTQRATIKPTNGAAFDNVGAAIALSSNGNTLAIGAPLHNVSGSNTGSAYVWVWDGANWFQQQELSVPNVMTNGQFGFSVSLSSDGNTCVVGYPYDSSGSVDQAGSIYLFSRVGVSWVRQQKIVATASSSTDRMGKAISLDSSGRYLAAGVDLVDTTAGSNAGAAYVFLW